MCVSPIVRAIMVRRGSLETRLTGLAHTSAAAGVRFVKKANERLLGNQIDELEGSNLKIIADKYGALI